MKIFIKVVVLLVLVVYLVLAVTKFNKGDDTSACRQVDIAVMDSSRAAFMSEEGVRSLLEKHHLNPQGLPMNRINSMEIEHALESHPYILDAQCYKTADDVVHIKVKQRLPVMRIMSCNGQNYFIDAQGKRMPHVNYSADVVVVTGAVTQHYARLFLAPLGCLLQSDDFWNSQMEQLNVLADGTVEMMPRVGNHIVYLGAPVGWKEKLSRLKTFYEKALCHVGWNKYSRINVEFGNQIICTKTE